MTPFVVFIAASYPPKVILFQVPTEWLTASFASKSSYYRSREKIDRGRTLFDIQPGGLNDEYRVKEGIEFRKIASRLIANHS